jgi:hypothetical protein
MSGCTDKYKARLISTSVMMYRKKERRKKREKGRGHRKIKRRKTKKEGP